MSPSAARSETLAGLSVTRDARPTPSPLTAGGPAGRRPLTGRSPSPPPVLRDHRFHGAGDLRVGRRRYNGSTANSSTRPSATAWASTAASGSNGPSSGWGRSGPARRHRSTAPRPTTGTSSRQPVGQVGRPVDRGALGAPPGPVVHAQWTSWRRASVATTNGASDDTAAAMTSRLHTPCTAAPTTEAVVRAVTSPDPQTGERSWSHPYRDVGDVPRLRPRLGHRLGQQRYQQLTVATGVDRGPRGQHPAPVVDRDRDRRRRGVEGEKEHDRRAYGLPAPGWIVSPRHRALVRPAAWIADGTWPIAARGGGR
jgi:hypothetical protein